MLKHLVTSGCSFSDNCTGRLRWPHFLAQALNVKLYNRGQGSAGNAWISKSAIYNTQQLLEQGVNVDEILVVVCWSGIDRKDLFVSETTPKFKNIINSNNHQGNPVNFVDTEINKMIVSDKTDGYLLGNARCTFDNANINTFKQELIKEYYCDEALAIESYENFLRLQWYCESKKIKLINTTFMDIMHYPYYKNKYYPDVPLSKITYSRNIAPLYNMIDFNKWVFWKETGGIYEYVVDKGLSFNIPGDIHPSIESYGLWVNNYLLPEIIKRGI